MGKEFLKGKYKPINTFKYIGDINDIVYRSSYELKFMKFCDLNESIIKWSSECLTIPYKSVDNKVHKYIPDFLIEIKDINNDIKKYLIEVKPYKQTIPPFKGRKRKKTILEESLIYEKNVSKWNAAREFCKLNGLNFLLITEKELYNV